ncbi:phosphotriesterase family protein [Clostridium polynesiense]|uniref:phosphotriesterase family protein n=1 Tax=Clostridium polynesiense TaxID=1325933 RepID=UPI00058B92E6|nr:hypothetical protein [Clostridium polynesiense]
MINTVNGIINEENLGITYSHEHIIVKPDKEDKKYLAYTLDDIEKSTKEVEAFKKNGGSTIVEMTPINYGRNVLAYKKISQETGVNIIYCTGFHKEEFLPYWVYEKTNIEIYNFVMKEIQEGMDDSLILPGVLKVGTSLNKIVPIEEKLINVMSRVQIDSGLPMNTHCDKGTMGREQAELLIKNGVNPDRIIIGHVDIPRDKYYLEDMCKMGVNISIDHVGRDMQKDIETIHTIKYLIEKGYRDKIFISGDMGKKSYLPAYGGEPGFRYILRDFKDEFVKILKDSDFNHILKENPKRVFRIIK